jgi:hypothetical protein
MRSKKGQVTLFIILAIVLVAGVVSFFLLRDRIGGIRLPASIEPAYNTFLTCLEEETEIGISVLESQGGYIELPDFEPGSVHMPFSSQLNFLGNPIPYWYYVSGNNIQKEQVPTKNDMESELQSFVEERIRSCNLDGHYDEGFEIVLEEPEVLIDIKKNDVQVKLNMKMTIEKGDDKAIVKNHQVNVKSKLGTLYDSAMEVYEKERRDLFLENFGVDILRLYAPVDGVEITCSPQIWEVNEIFDNLEEAIEINTFALRTEGNDYFSVDVNTNSEVRFINSRDWSSTFEVLPSEGEILLANPVGNQPGLGILGFCYVPYHFVYDMKYPVLVQVSDDDETFQFPLAVVIQGNQPREALDASASSVDIELCKYKNTPINVQTYDGDLNPVEAQVSYECFGEKCNIGTTIDGFLEADFPQCVNGNVLAKAEGFRDATKVFSTTQEGSVNIILDRLYEIEVDLKLDGNSYGDSAIIYFISEKSTSTIIYPDQKIVELSEGQYEIQVYVYGDSSIQLDEIVYEECVTVPRGGLGGIFGMTSQQCFDVEVPTQVVSNALVGGGKQNHYILESILQGSNKIEIRADSLPSPSTVEELQNNYLLFEDMDLEVLFR